MAQVTKQIISPVFVTESGDSYIALDGKAFLVGENTITEAEITTAPGEFRSLVLALNNFTLTNEGLTWFNGINRIRFVRESNNFFVNNSEVLAESLTNHLLASGIVNYTNKAKIPIDLATLRDFLFYLLFNLAISNWIVFSKYTLVFILVQGIY